MKLKFLSIFLLLNLYFVQSAFAAQILPDCIFKNTIKFEQIKNDDLQDFINLQIDKHEKGLYVRELDEWELEGYKNPIEYFKSDTVQEFLTKINNKTFVKIIERILDNKQNNLIGTPDYIIWNSKDMIFVEVKRKSEKLSEGQIAWGEFLVKNKISYRVVRVIGI